MKDHIIEMIVIVARCLMVVCNSVNVMVILNYIIIFIKVVWTMLENRNYLQVNEPVIN